MQAIRWGLAIAVVLCGCSGGDTSSSGGNTSRGTSGLGPGGVATGTGGSGSTGDTTGGNAGAFGNSSGNAPGVGGGSGGASSQQTTGDAGMPSDGSDCQAGQFCAPSGPDPNGCGTLTLESTVKTVTMPGNVLLIFDRSWSMSDQWNGMVKWQAAGQAIIGALMPLQDLLTIGGVMYPSNTAGPNDIGLICNVDQYSSPEQLAFQPGAMALQALQSAPPSGMPSPMYAAVGGDQGLGATPTTEAVLEANVALQNTTLMGTTVAILITDGEPNCAWDQAMTTSTVSGWLSGLGIKTYVIGLPGVNGNGPAVLNAIAQAGGTDQYIVPTDATMLQQKLSDIVMQTVKAGFDSCSIDLTPAADPVDKLQLVATEQVMGVPTEESVPHTLDMGVGGWTITSDGTHVELTGSICDDAKGGRFDKLEFKYGCKELPPLPPTPPPD